MKQIVEKKDIKIKIGDNETDATLLLPQGILGLVIFAHGSSSNRFSPRNNFIAEKLACNKIGSLLVDLLTKEEEEYRPNVFDIELLSNRLIFVTQYILEKNEFKNIPIGYFGASTGAAAALSAAAILGNKIKAIVSRGGRPDLALNQISKVSAPTLLIVGSLDAEVINLNKITYKKLTLIPKKMSLIKGAGHLFEGPGELEEVSNQASEWFLKYLR